MDWNVEYGKLKESLISNYKERFNSIRESNPNSSEDSSFLKLSTEIQKEIEGSLLGEKTKEGGNKYICKFKVDLYDEFKRRNHGQFKPGFEIAGFISQVEDIRDRNKEHYNKLKGDHREQYYNDPEFLNANHLQIFRLMANVEILWKIVWRDTGFEILSDNQDKGAINETVPLSKSNGSHSLIPEGISKEEIRDFIENVLEDVVYADKTVDSGKITGAVAALISVKALKKAKREHDYSPFFKKEFGYNISCKRLRVHRYLNPETNQVYSYQQKPAIFKLKCISIIQENGLFDHGK
ncbi:hypothetical protein [Ekhidna sp.]|uniref:hypothetical protein n=1 Tax=Ekhidna sp. TaxID=2608089 RepID=UPI003B5CFCCD